MDNAATTRPREEVIQVMDEVLRKDYGNPSAMYSMGLEAEKIIKKARDDISGTLKCARDEIIFTSGGTESNNLAIVGAALANKRRGMHIITTSYEHPSVANPMHALEDMGFEVTYLPVDNKGTVKQDFLEDSVREDTILVSIMHVNNEIGAMNPIGEIGKIIKNKNRDIIFHVDAVQSYGKELIRPNKEKIDLLSVSGHKIKGPKGVGFIYIRKGTKISPLMLGGGQQDGYRSGTENTPGIAGLSMACKMAYENLEKNRERMIRLRNYFIGEVSRMEGVTVNGPIEEGASPHIISMSVRNVRAEVLLHSLEDRGIYISAGSACSTHKRAASSTLLAIGTDKDLLESTVRVSLGFDTTGEDVEACVRALWELIPALGRYVRE